MLVKCICTNCAGHLAFEEQNAGESINCPHCGFKTILELPDAKKADPEMTSLIQKLALRRRQIVGAATILVLAGIGFALYHWGVPWLMGRVPEIESNITAMVVLVLLCLALPFVLFWLVFPALLFFQLRKIIQLLSQTAEQASPGEPENQAESEEAAHAPSEHVAKSTSEVKAATR